MTPIEIAIFSSVFFAIVMLVFVVMFFTTAGLGKSKERSFSFASGERLFELYRKNADIPRALPVPSANAASEQIRQAIADGALLRARVLAVLVGELRMEPDFCPRELAQVFLPDLHQLQKPVDAETFFKAVAHPSIQSPLTPLLAAMANPLLFAACSPPAAHDLGGEHEALRKRSMEPVLGMVYQLSRLLLPFEPDVYYLDEEIDLLHAHTRQTEIWMPSLVAGRIFMQRPIEEKRVLVARKLALFRPELRILTVVPDEAGFIRRISEIIGHIREGREDAIPGWNRVPEKHGIPFRFSLPHKGFHRKIGLFAEYHVSPDGLLMSESDWTRRHGDWLPSAEDRAFVHSLMGRVAEPGKFANWIGRASCRERVLYTV